MFRLKLSNIKVLSFLILILCLVSIGKDISFVNKIFWVSLIVISYFLLQFKFRFKNLLIGGYGLLGIYIQLRLNQFVFSEEFFLNCLGVLLIAKYSEIITKNNQLSFSLIAMVVAVASLIKGQDLFSSATALTIIILSIINMYLVQQKEVMDFNFKNILKYLGFGLSIFPFIIIFYLLFPRAEVNFRLFDPSASSLGIPDSINLGSFREFSNSEEPVFTLINKNYQKDELYFRVKIFDYMEKNKSWRPTSNIYMYNTFKNHIKINKGQNKGETYEIILEPYKGKWIPSLSNSKLITNDNTIMENPFNQNFTSRNPIDRKKKLEFSKYKPDQELYFRLLEYYTLLPDTVSKDLKNWAEENKQNRTDKEYLNIILQTFANGSYYYNLSPENLSGNSYSDFFLKNKEGYCEYFAGTFVLLARLANIPSRIVSGYLGGDLNDIGNFYVFRQKDTHAWAEVWFENEGWVRVDPTRFIPAENVRNTLNDLFNSNKTSENFISLKMFKYIGYYINYADFVWTQHLLSYDNSQRQSFIEDLINFKFSKVFLWIFAPITLFIFVRFLFLLNKTKITQIKVNLIIWRFKKKYNLHFSDTHQEILNKFPSKEKLKYRKLFNNFEILKYSK
tara:strand:+ start:10645 stop:12501 length:1857 start_codon:yes stop_codon:yes gene_type:complete